MNMKPDCWCGSPILVDMTNWKPYCSGSPEHDPYATGGLPPTQVRKLYIAGPMSGIEDCNYPRFNEVAAALREAGFEVVNPAELSVGLRAHYTDYLRQDLRALLDCEGVATLEGWEFSTGARNEAQVAGLLRMPVRNWSYWARLKVRAK